MNIGAIVADLDSQRDRLERAIAALSALYPGSRRKHATASRKVFARISDQNVTQDLPAWISVEECSYPFVVLS